VSLRVVLTSAYAWPEVHRGGERYLHELAAALRRRGHRVRVLCGAPAAGRDEVLGVPVRRVRRHRIRPAHYREVAGEVGFGLSALRLLAAAPLDVWHAGTTADAAAAAAAGLVRPGLRTVFTDHGFPVAASRTRRPDARLHAFAARHVDHYVCVSRAAGSFLGRDYGRPADVVPPGVDTTTFRPVAPREARPSLLYTGSLVEPRKNLPELVRAAALLAARVAGLQLWLLGPGDPGPLLAGCGPAAQVVTHTALVEPAELPRWYSRAWVTVLPSVNEAFGMALTESLACGRPVVARADGGGPAEVVTGSTGVLSGPGEQALADACDRALDLAARADTEAACRERALEYDWDRSVAPQIERVYLDG
jgi:glycosyltransferase involved in cell wall biosynthesis